WRQPATTARPSSKAAIARAGQEPTCDTPQDHADLDGAPACGPARRVVPAALHRQGRGLLLVPMQGGLRCLLQEQPGPLQVPGAAATLPGELPAQPQRALTAQPRTRITHSRRGPCAPITSWPAMSAVRDGPEMKLTVRGIAPRPKRARIASHAPS